MERKKDSPEELLKVIVKLDPLEFLGVCKVIGVEVLEEIGEVKSEVEVDGGQAKTDTISERPPREFEDIWADVCDTISSMNRTRRRNLGKLVRAAAKR